MATTADGSELLRAPEGKPIEIYEIATWKRRGHIRGWKTEMGNPARFVDVSTAGPSIIAWADASPVSAAGRIFTLNGKLLIGDEGFSQEPANSWPANGTTWLFKQIATTKLVAVDVATGNSIAAYDLKPLAAGINDEYVMPAGAAGSADRIVYLSQAGVVGVISHATGAVEVISSPRC